MFRFYWNLRRKCQEIQISSGNSARSKQKLSCYSAFFCQKNRGHSWWTRKGEKNGLFILKRCPPPSTWRITWLPSPPSRTLRIPNSGPQKEPQILPSVKKSRPNWVEIQAEKSRPVPVVHPWKRLLWPQLMIWTLKLILKLLWFIEDPKVWILNEDVILKWLLKKQLSCL